MVRRGVGDLSDWPALPDSFAAPVLGPRLSLLAPAFAGPRTLRGSFALSRVLWAGTTLQLSADYRRTDVLPRTRDLNLAPLPVSNGMTNLAMALRYAARHGFADLELEPGTESFTPNPASLLPRSLSDQE